MTEQQLLEPGASVQNSDGGAANSLSTADISGGNNWGMMDGPAPRLTPEGGKKIKNKITKRRNLRRGEPVQAEVRVQLTS